MSVFKSAFLLLALASFVAAQPKTQKTHQISGAELRDKIAGGWAGQMIGVSFGAPTEFKSNARINESVLPPWTPDRVSNSLQQDDLYVDMTFANVLDEKGLHATTQDFADMFKNAKYHLWHANLAARRALRRGVSGELSGTPRYNAHANDIDFQIESDFIGLMAPGLPVAATDMALRAGRVMNYGDGIYGGMFVSCMYSAGFFNRNPREVVQAGLACLPSNSAYAQVISDVLNWSARHPDDWKQVWRLIENKWDKRDPCPEGALRPFNIDAKLNGSYIALGLIYGKGDMGRTIEVATRSGQDSDCNPASAAGILGVMLGYDAIPVQWKSGIDEIADKKFDWTNYTFKTIVDSTYKRTLALIHDNGGEVNGNWIVVKMQTPKPVQLPLWDNYGSPVERVSSADKRWIFKGNWRTEARDSGSSQRITRYADSKGAEAQIAFTGTGVIVAGPYLPNGGKVDVYLDGKLQGSFDSYSDEDQGKNSDSVWHTFGLSNTAHTVRLVVQGVPYPGSRGAEIGIEDLVYFK